MCHTCLGINKHRRGTPEFVERQTEFESFSDAWAHMMENYSSCLHWMEAVIIKEADEE